MKRLLAISLAIVLFFGAGAVVRHRIVIPDIPGYVTLKGDFHVHTVFSDDKSWPTSRIDEAYYDGLDVISITDHCDTRHQKQIKAGYLNSDKCDRNSSYKFARKHAKQYGMIVLHGAELTRGVRIFPGHFNAHFISDGNSIAERMEAQDGEIQDKTKREEVALQNGLKAAREQGAFLVWNHPNWEPQEPNEVRWWPIHETLFKAGLMDGIEIENHSVGYSPEAFHFAMERNLTIVSGTDCHKPMNQLVDYELGEYRSMTLIFARERTEESVREALNEHRTAVYADGSIYGKEEFIRPLLDASLKIDRVKVRKGGVSAFVTNLSSVPVRIRKATGSEDVVMDRVRTINPGEECWLSFTPVGGKKAFDKSKISVNYYVDNYQTDANTPLLVSYRITLPEE